VKPTGFDGGSILPFRLGQPRARGASRSRALRALLELPGSWVGGGLHVQTGPPPTGGTAPVQVTVDLTRETITFAAVSVPASPGRTRRGDGEIPGVYFLRRVSDAVTGRMLRAESGAWLSVKATNTGHGGPSLLWLGSALGDGELLAAGAHRLILGPPRIEPLDMIPVELTDRTPITTPERFASLLPAGVRPDLVLDPAVMLTDRLLARHVTRTAVLPVSTDNEPGEAAADISSSAFRKREHAGLTAEVTLWLQTLAAENTPADGPQALQFLSRRVLDDGGISRSEVWVADLERS